MIFLAASMRVQSKSLPVHQENIQEEAILNDLEFNFLKPEQKLEILIAIYNMLENNKNDHFLSAITSDP